MQLPLLPGGRPEIARAPVSRPADPRQLSLNFEKPTSNPNQLDLFVSHQANRRIITAVADRLGLPDDKVIINLDMYGNTTAATIPLALNDAMCSGRLKKGNLVLLASVGAGFTVGAVLVRWGL